MKKKETKKETKKRTRKLEIQKVRTDKLKKGRRKENEETTEGRKNEAKETCTK